MTDLWPRIEPLLRRVERPSRYLDHEWGSRAKGAAFRFCMAYPDTYELGQANQAVRILTNIVNETDGMAAERCFLPAVDMCDALREEGVPLFSLESCAPVREFDVLGITLPHELAASNVLEILSLAEIPLRAENRAQDDPFVVGGGPCSMNPEPWTPFFDCIQIGEGEEALVEVLGVIREGREAQQSREDILLSLTQISGCYVPSLYEVVSDDDGSFRAVPTTECAPEQVVRRVFTGFPSRPAYEPCLVPFTEVVHDRLNVEVLRGCTRGCRFCQAGMMYRPVRERSAESIIAAVEEGLAKTGYDEVSLTSLSTTDHSQIAQILRSLNARYADKGVRISIPSQRLDSFGAEMADLVAGRKKGGLTFAPEAGTQRLRDVINKNVTEEDVMGAVRSAFQRGWRNVKLYFMIGLPTETDEDIIGIAELAERVLSCAKEACPEKTRSQVSVTVSCAVFVPKAQTPFQWDGQIAPEEAARRIALVRRSLRHKAITVSWHDPKTSSVEAVMSRGGREVGRAIELAWEKGARFCAWTELFNEEAWRSAFEEAGIDPARTAQASYTTEHVLPWEHISCGVSREFFVRERERASRGETTPDCSFEHCSDCGACPSLGARIDLVAPRKKRSEGGGR